MMNKLKEYLKLIRVKHYIKNFLVFLPLVFSGRLLEKELLCKGLIAFLSFCFIASVVYIINDIFDLEKDRLHEVKKNRPLAKGSVSIKEAMALVVILFLCAVGVMIYMNNYVCVFLLMLYLIINILYSFKLKNVPIVDIAILTSGFVIRVVYGGLCIGIEISSWLCLTVMSMAFYLSLGKRRNEIDKIGGKKNTREVLKYYTRSYLDKFMYLCLTLTIVFYSLWTTTNMNLKYNKYLIWTVPFVILICMKYSMVIEGESDGDPVEVVLNDKVLLFLILSYAFVIIILFYF